MAQFKGVCVGAGYFSHFQYEAWQRIDEVTITGMCNRNPERAQVIMDQFIDTYRYLAGEIESVYAVLKKLNPVIAGADFGVVTFNFASGATGLWDADRYNESNSANPRYTFGEFLIDGDGGSIRLYNDERLTIQRLGQGETEHRYAHENRNFSGDCCYTTERHFIDRLLDGGVFETNGPNYLRTLAVQGAVYLSAEQGRPVEIP